MVKEVIKNCRMNSGYTQEKLSSLMNVSRQTVSNWETGRFKPDPDMAKQLSELFGLPAAAFYDDGFTHQDPVTLAINDGDIDSVLNRLHEIQLVLENNTKALDSAEKANKRLRIALILTIVFFVFLLAFIIHSINWRDPNTPDVQPHIVYEEEIIESEI